MKITKTYLESLKPCKSRWENYLKHYSDWEGDIKDFVDLPEIDIDDIFWVLDKTDALKPKNFVELAIIFAEDVLPIFEAEYPGDKRPRKAIEAAKNGNMDMAINAAIEAADAAIEAADAASAAWAAVNAARAAASSAAWAAYAVDAGWSASAASSAEYAAEYAARAAAWAVDATEEAAWTAEAAERQKQLWQRQQIKNMIQSIDGNQS